MAFAVYFVHFLLCAYIVTVITQKGAKSDNDVTDPCPPWGEWRESSSDKCVSPYDLKCAVYRQCQPPSASYRSSQLNYFGNAGYRARRSPWNSMSMRWNRLTSGGSASSSGFSRSDRGSFGRSNSLGSGLGSRKRSMEQCVSHGTHYRNGGDMYFDPLMCLQTCGSCSIRFRCRSRDMAFGCSPPVEVERAQCDKGADSDACEMPMEKCNRITNKRMLTVDAKTGKSRFRSLSSATATQWTKVNDWDKKPCGRSGRAKRFALDDFEVEEPQLNCAATSDNKQCHCCCNPMIPVNGTCVQGP